MTKRSDKSNLEERGFVSVYGSREIASSAARNMWQQAEQRGGRNRKLADFRSHRGSRESGKEGKAMKPQSSPSLM